MPSHLYMKYQTASNILQCNDHRKIAWVDWNNVCRSKEVGGLGVTRISEFNTALFGKWCWRLMTYTSSLWFRVLSARYGMEGGRLKAGGREASSWWRDISLMSRECWFSDHVNRLLGNGKHMLFWSDVWCSEVSFRVSSLGYMSCQRLKKYLFLICIT